MTVPDQPADPRPSWTGDETLDPKRSLLSEVHQGTMAERLAVPRRNVVPKPAELGFTEAACLPTAWLTAYRMLFTQSGVRPGDSILVQGAGGGVATALVVLGRAAGLRVFVTSRDENKRQRALDLGAAEAFEPGARLPQRVDAVMETVGQATWSHSVKALRPGVNPRTDATSPSPQSTKSASSAMMTSARSNRGTSQLLGPNAACAATFCASVRAGS